MGNPNKDKQKPVENKDLDLAKALDLSEEDVTEHVEDETEEEVQASAVSKEQPKPNAEPQQVKPEPKRNPTKDEIVKDGNGNPAYKRLAPTIVHEAPKKLRPQPATKLADKRTATEPSANAALLTYPTDRWGITKDLKKAMTHLASRIAGDQNKKDLADEVLKILVLHLNAKFKSDQEYKKQLAARIERQEAEQEEE